MKKCCFFIILVIFEDLSRGMSEELQESVKNAFCDAQCVEESKTSSFCTNTECISNCSLGIHAAGTQKPTTAEEKPFTEPQLLCKTENTLTFTWNTTGPLIFLVESSTNESHQWDVIKKTACPEVVLANLEPDSRHGVRLWGLSSDNRLFGPSPPVWGRTLSQNYAPEPVAAFDLVALKLTGKTMTAVLTWKPNQEPSCFYDITCFVDDADEGTDYVIREIRNPEQLFFVEIPKLKFEFDYWFTIRSKSGDLRRESDEVWLNITTPTCMEVLNDLDECVPNPPNDLRAYETDITNSTYDLMVTWTPPAFLPDFYSIDVILKDSPIVQQNVTGNESSAYFSNLPLLGDYYIRAVGSSKAGFGKAAFVFRELNITTMVPARSSSSPTSWFRSTTAIVGFTSFSGFLAVAFLVFLLLHRRCRMRTAKRREDATVSNYYGPNFKEKAMDFPPEYYVSALVDDEWRLDADCVVLDAVLGEGAFGVVHRGFLHDPKGRDTEVAVKMLKGNPNVEEIRQFEQEIEIMKSVGCHPHLVSILGCCCKTGYLGPFLVVEYCSKGDLQTYLRGVWENISGETMEMRYVNTPNGAENMENDFSNRTYDFFEDVPLEPKDLLSFGRQIVLGMEYLSNLRVVHRDLAARNVLMCENRTVKVADFGLSRDVYQDNIYTKIGAGRLPVKWMALESLSHQQYTTQSDVWSFGVVLWEITTLGGHPYVTVATRDLLGLLKSGYRLERPQNCSQELYEVMSACWREVAKERPTFTELRNVIERLLENEHTYVSLDVRF